MTPREALQTDIADIITAYQERERVRFEDLRSYAAIHGVNLPTPGEKSKRRGWAHKFRAFAHEHNLKRKARNG
jgi:hypothetical protein